MINKILKITVIIYLFITIAYGANGTRFNVINGDVGKKYEHFLDLTLEKKTGYTVSDPHERINDAYEKRYGNKSGSDYDKEWKRTLDNLGFYSISNDTKLNTILKVAPEVAAFAPFNQLIYKNVNENKTYIGHLDPQTMLNIVGTKDKNIRKAFIDTFISLDKWTQDELGGTAVTSTFNTLPAKTMMNFELPVDRLGDLEDFIGDFEDTFESAFEDKEYIIGGYKNFKETYEELKIPFEEYDSFSVYSLCHFEFSYNIFNKGRPDAGVFAPCSMYMYIKKDSNKMIIGMPMLENWVSVMNIKDTKKIEWIKRIDNEIISIMKSMGAKEI